MEFPGGRQTVERLVDEHYLPLYRYAYRLSGSSADADDLTQEAFCKAQANLAQLRDAGRARPWLFSILRNAYLHRIRSQRQQRFISLDAVTEPAEPLPPAQLARDDICGGTHRRGWQRRGREHFGQPDEAMQHPV